ncbi:MAG: 4Fe-4S dicluster domain-containing protein [Myxococcales bacterium]|nr:4Fe-4S dicluster domain-containing protein [Myxococcales bacterium]
MIRIDEKICRACGICGIVCPRHIPETTESNGKKRTAVSPERAALCMDCGHCAAVCPVAAIDVDGLAVRDFAPLQTLDLDADRLLTLFRQRRSVRRYQDKPVPREVLDRIAGAAHAAPTGSGSLSTAVIIIDREATMKKMMKSVYQMYGMLDRVVQNPLARQFIRFKESTATLEVMRNFAMPGVRWYRKWYLEGKGDEIRRDCPAMLLFHGPRFEPGVVENCTIAALHSIFMAEVLGVGSCFNSLLPPICSRSATVRKILKLEKDRDVHVCVTLGYPKFPFRRVIPRRLAEVRYLD